MAAKKAPAKKAASQKPKEQQKGPRWSDPVVDSRYGTFDKTTKKAALQARGRAEKVGRASSPTISGRDGNKVWSQTEVMGPYGTTMFVNEDKKINRFRPDTRKTRVTEGYPNAKGKAGDLGSARAKKRAADKAKRATKKK